MIRCKTCKIDRLPDNFGNSARHLNGKQLSCKSCIHQKRKSYPSLSKGSARARYKKYLSNPVNKEKEKSRKRTSKARMRRRLYGIKNRTKLATYHAIWRENNLLYKLRTKAACAKRRASRINATPSWLSKEQLNEIKKIYECCPKGFEVDHIIPLQGKAVSGLHVPWNLQYLTIRDNRAKSNKLKL